jgi:hypothetical protein
MRENATTTRLGVLVQRRRNGDERAGWGIGAIVRQLRASTRRGDSWFVGVSLAVGMSKSALYERERLVRCWNAREFDRLLRLRGRGGANLCEAHLLVIARVTRESKREALIERVLAQGLSVRELRDVVVREALAGNSSGNARTGRRSNVTSRLAPS